MLRRNGPDMKSVESVLKPEGSLWWERLVNEVGVEPGVKEGVMDGESGELLCCMLYRLTFDFELTFHIRLNTK